MNNIVQHIRQRAAGMQKQVVFPEGNDLRVQKAAKYLVENEICSVTLLHSGSLSPSEIFQTLNCASDPLNIRDFTQPLWESQQQALGNPEEAQELLQKPLYYASSLVSAGFADACVAGATSTTAEVIRCAIKTIGLKEDRNIVSSIFLMVMPSGDAFTYADCGVVPYPDKKQLADIALESARTHKRLTGTEPRVALLSFSTKGSAPHERTQLIRDALKIVKLKIMSSLLMENFSLMPPLYRKLPNEKPLILFLKAGPMCLFFQIWMPQTSYKITERLAGVGATGPILQGLKRPMMDLSRGCGYEDIINDACVAILMGEN